MNGKEKICVVDSDLEFLEYIERPLRTAGYAVETCQSGKEFLTSLSSRNISCVIFDVNMPDLKGPELQRTLAFRRYDLPIIFVAEPATLSIGIQTMKAGAIDFLVKPPDEHRLLAAVQEANLRYRKNQEIAAASGQFNSLTEREKQVFTLVTTGMLNKQIAAELGIAEKTIKVHRGRVMRKLAVQSVAELVRLSEKLSFTQPFSKGENATLISTIAKSDYQQIN